MRIRQEWRKYWYYTLVKTRSVFASMALSLLFYAIKYPALAPEERWIQFWVALTYGFMIYAGIWLGYVLLWAWLTHDMIRTGKLRNLHSSAHFAITFLGLNLGLLAAGRVQKMLTGQTLDTSSFLESLISGCFIGCAFIYYRSFKASREENLQLKAANSEAKFHVLENQMKPHFLFNSLNSLSQLIDENPARASEMAQKLSDLYREILANSKLKTATLDSELSIVDKYLDLEKVRYGDRLQVQVERPTIAENIYVPSLILQTLVENSIKHGIAKSIHGGKVRVSVQPSTVGYEINVGNSAGSAPIHAESEGTGLKNTRTRLDLLYGDRHGFSLDHADGETVARFHVTGDGR